MCSHVVSERIFVAKHFPTMWANVLPVFIAHKICEIYRTDGFDGDRAFLVCVSVKIFHFESPVPIYAMKKGTL